MNPTKRSEPARQEPLASQQRVACETDTVTRRSHARVCHIGATEDQVSMVGIVPERVDKHGTKIEDIAGTGQHDSLGG
jgi:hypothetical protein